MLDDRTLGLAAALGSAMSWALGSVLFKMLGDKLPPIPLTFAKGITGAFMLGLLLAGIGLRGLDSQAILLLILSGTLGIAIGDTFFLWRCEVSALTQSSFS